MIDQEITSDVFLNLRPRNYKYNAYSITVCCISASIYHTNLYSDLDLIASYLAWNLSDYSPTITHCLS